MNAFAERLLAWHAAHGRHDLPWQRDRDPYRIWLSEIMLQQTQVQTVIPYFRRFVERFPDLASLAAAEPEQVLGLWSGLGYYARARNLLACARQLVADHGGRFPEDPAAIARLPGIGRSTAAAIATFAFGARAAILDGNVRRLLCRFFAIEGFPGTTAVEARLWRLAASLLPAEHAGPYIQAQMDLGATLCVPRRPRCGDCPLQADCIAHRDRRTDDLPAPRPRRERPRRSCEMLAVRHCGAVLLQRRPPAGVWGGLLSLPELGAQALGIWATQHLGVEPAAVRRLPSRVHEFTHFTLLIEARLLELAKPPVVVADPAWRWLPLAGLGEAPLPQPVRAILSELPAEELSAPAGDAGAGTAG